MCVPRFISCHIVLMIMGRNGNAEHEPLYVPILCPSMFPAMNPLCECTKTHSHVAQLCSVRYLLCGVQLREARMYETKILQAEVGHEG